MVGIFHGYVSHNCRPGSGMLLLCTTGPDNNAATWNGSIFNGNDSPKAEAFWKNSEMMKLGILQAIRQSVFFKVFWRFLVLKFPTYSHRFCGYTNYADLGAKDGTDARGFPGFLHEIPWISKPDRSGGSHFKFQPEMIQRCSNITVSMTISGSRATALSEEEDSRSTKSCVGGCSFLRE